jgi:hypothetical protein
VIAVYLIESPIDFLPDVPRQLLVAGRGQTEARAAPF